MPEPPAAPCSPQKVFLDPSCLCLFQWQGARSFSSPSSPSPGLCSLPGQGKGAQMSRMSGNTGLTPLLGQRTSSVSPLCGTLGDQCKTVWSVKPSCPLLFPQSWRERGPSGGPGCGHHIYKCGKQRLTSHEPCGIINTHGFSFSYWRESCKHQLALILRHYICPQ